mmetsp:Transcript_78702/g.131977  ORF Transcript_78702/g.131977 Transcript_78702/m.131977 type:complete len:206 (+) Transcript_78702:2921-3538(+)
MRLAQLHAVQQLPVFFCVFLCLAGLLFGSCFGFTSSSRLLWLRWHVTAADLIRLRSRRGLLPLGLLWRGFLGRNLRGRSFGLVLCLRFRLLLCVLPLLCSAGTLTLLRDGTPRILDDFHFTCTCRSSGLSLRGSFGWYGLTRKRQAGLKLLQMLLQFMHLLRQLCILTAKIPLEPNYTVLRNVLGHGLREIVHVFVKHIKDMVLA